MKMVGREGGWVVKKKQGEEGKSSRDYTYCYKLKGPNKFDPFIEKMLATCSFRR